MDITRGYMALAEHLEKLRYFHKVCAYPSIQAAAKAMGISQAGLSKSLQSLEEALNTKLFVRSVHGLTLTPQGKMLFETSKRILDDALLFDAKLNAHSPSLPDVIKFGMYDSIAVYFYSNLASYFKSVYPTIEFTLNVERSSTLAQKLLNGELDVVLGVNLSSKKDVSQYLHLWDDEYAFYLSNKLDENVDDLPIIFYPDATDSDGKPTEFHLKPLLQKRSQVRVYNFETIKSLATSGLGIAAMPTQVAKPLVRQGALRQIRIARMKQSFGLHSIGLLASKKLQEGHLHLVEDIHRLGRSWGRY